MVTGNAIGITEATSEGIQAPMVLLNALLG